MNVIEIFIFIIPLVIIIRLIAGVMDHYRVEKYVSSRGGKVIEKHWNPFGKGWFGSKNERIYKVKYIDKDGNLHHATCKTSVLAGVYFTEDLATKNVQYAGTMNKKTELEIENLRLKKEIEELKRGRGI